MKACLFDMDGLLLNTEDMYTEVTNEVLAEFGKGPLPWEIKVGLQGLPGPMAAKKFLEWSQLPFTPEELFAKTSKLQKQKWLRTAFLPGALELIQWLHANKVPFALATSSHTQNYQLKTAHLRDTFDLFGPHVVTGDDPRIPPGRGKPAPDIWLIALESLNQERRTAGDPEIDIADCFVFEDGVAGVQAGKAAGAQVVWVPDQRALAVLPDAQELIDGHQLLESLEQFDPKKYVQHS